MNLEQLDIMIHYNLRPELEYHKVFVDENRFFNLNGLISDGMLNRCKEDEIQVSITDKGLVHLKQVMNLAHPTLCYVSHDGKFTKVK